MAEGIVTRYSEDKGFGFIRQEDGKKVLVERNSLDMPDYKTLNPDDRVTFDIKQTTWGLKAENVRRFHN